MKKVGKAIAVALFFAVLWGAAVGLQATPPKPLQLTYCEIELVSYDKSTGHLILELRINFAHYDARFTTCDMVTVRISGVDGLEYTGPEQWEVQSDTLAPDILTRLEVTAPPNDTSGLIVIMECGEHQSNYPTYFITTADTLRTVGSNPREWPKMPTEEESRLNRLKDYERAKREWEERQEQLQRFKGKSTTGPVINPEDSALVDSLSDMGKRQLGRMRMLECSPLTDQDRQVLAIDGRWYERKRGETKFRHIPGKTKKEIYADAQRYWDSLTAHPPNNVYDVILDLRDPDDYEFAKTLVDSLMPTEQVGFYRAVVRKTDISKLRDKGIEFRRANRPPLVPSDSTRPHRPRGPEPEKKSESSLPVREGQDVLFFEGFEGAWPGHSDHFHVRIEDPDGTGN